MDHRIRITKQILKESLLALMKEKPVSKITVKELCEQSKLSRPTFYQHYRDVYDLADQTEEELIQLILSVSGNEPVTSKKDQIEINRKMCRLFLENEDLFLCFYGPNGDPGLTQKVIHAVYSLTETINSQHVLNYVGSEQIYAIQYLYVGTFAVVYEWLKKGEYRESVNEISDLIARLTFEGINSKRHR